MKTIAFNMRKGTALEMLFKKHTIVVGKPVGVYSYDNVDYDDYFGWCSYSSLKYEVRNGCIESTHRMCRITRQKHFQEKIRQYVTVDSTDLILDNGRICCMFKDDHIRIINIRR